MIFTNIKMALTSIRSARVRSALTMLGVVVGVSSVVITIGLGEGIKQQVLQQVSQLGNDVIVIRSGPANQSGRLGNLGAPQNDGISTLTTADIAAVTQVPGVAAVSSATRIGGLVTSTNNPGYSGGQIMAVSTNVLDVLGQEIQFGEFFGDEALSAQTVVIGSDVADALFKVRDPIGRTVTLRGQEFTIRGVLKPLPEAPFGFGPSSNDVVYIPLGTAKQLVGGDLPITEIHAKLTPGKDLGTISDAVFKTVLGAHGNQADFHVIKQTEYLTIVNEVFSVLTAFVAAIAGISLLVGGIGIMNIMLVSVSERTREIGIRKAVGATNRQILGQFLVESMTISLFGGIFGVLFSIFASFVLRVTTPLHPSLSPELLIASVGVATIVGVIFGVAPAIQAARKDPIVALRHE